MKQQAHGCEYREVARTIGPVTKGHGKVLMACSRCSKTKVVKVAMQPV